MSHSIRSSGGRSICYTTETASADICRFRRQRVIERPQTIYTVQWSGARPVLRRPPALADTRLHSRVGGWPNPTTGFEIILSFDSALSLPHEGPGQWPLDLPNSREAEAPEIGLVVAVQFGPF
jgi:hypothetical protein